MPTTYEPIATTTLGSAAASVSFTSISGSYTDLVVVNFTISGNGSASLTVNGDTGSNYSRTFMYGDGSSAASGRSSNASSFTYTVGGTTNVYSATILNLMNYSNSTTYKTFLLRGNDPSGATAAHIGLWRNTAAITSLTITCASGNFPTGSTFTLYGIKAA